MAAAISAFASSPLAASLLAASTWTLARLPLAPPTDTRTAVTVLLAAAAAGCRPRRPLGPEEVDGALVVALLAGGEVSAGDAVLVSIDICESW